MTINNTSEAAKAVVRRNTEEVQGGGNFEVFDESPGTNLPILNVRFDGEYRGQSRQHMLNASSSHFDPSGHSSCFRLIVQDGSGGIFGTEAMRQEPAQRSHAQKDLAAV